MPVSQPSASRIACSSGATLRRPQQRSGSRSQSAAPCVDRLLLDALQRAQRLDLEAVALDEALARLVRLREQQAGVDLDEARLRGDLARHVHEDRGADLPRAREHHAGRRTSRRRTRRAPPRAAARSARRAARRPRTSDRRRGWRSAHTYPSNQTRLSQPEGALMQDRVARACPRAAAPAPNRPAPASRGCRASRSLRSAPGRAARTAVR